MNQQAYDDIVAEAAKYYEEGEYWRRRRFLTIQFKDGSRIELAVEPESALYIGQCGCSGSKSMDSLGEKFLNGETCAPAELETMTFGFPEDGGDDEPS